MKGDASNLTFEHETDFDVFVHYCGSSYRVALCVEDGETFWAFKLLGSFGQRFETLDDLVEFVASFDQNQDLVFADQSQRLPLIEVVATFNDPRCWQRAPASFFFLRFDVDGDLVFAQLHLVRQSIASTTDSQLRDVFRRTMKVLSASHAQDPAFKDFADDYPWRLVFEDAEDCFNYVVSQAQRVSSISLIKDDSATL